MPAESGGGEEDGRVLPLEDSEREAGEEKAPEESGAAKAAIAPPEGCAGSQELSGEPEPEGGAVGEEGEGSEEQGVGVGPDEGDEDLAFGHDLLLVAELESRVVKLAPEAIAGHAGAGVEVEEVLVGGRIGEHWDESGPEEEAGGGDDPEEQTVELLPTLGH
jgi:hypothetical protein